MRDSIMNGQDKFIMCVSDDAEVGVCEDCDEDLLDVGCNTDLYVANHESVDLIYEDQVRARIDKVEFVAVLLWPLHNSYTIYSDSSIYLS